MRGWIYRKTDRKKERKAATYLILDRWIDGCMDDEWDGQRQIRHIDRYINTSRKDRALIGTHF